MPDLAQTTLQLVDTPSESRDEAAAVELIRELMPGAPAFDDGEVLLYGDGPVVLAGHLDTIPAQGNIPGRIENGCVHGVGASDMKGGVAVMVELARAGIPGRYLFFTREEVPVVEAAEGAEAEAAEGEPEGAGGSPTESSSEGGSSSEG